MMTEEKLKKLQKIADTAKGYFLATPLTPSDIDYLFEAIQDLQAENEKLVKLMPHRGETCKNYDDSGNPFPPCKANKTAENLVCYIIDQCVIDKWKLRD